MVDVIVNLSFVLVFIVLANVIVRLGNERLRQLFDVGLLLIGIPVLVVGIFFVLAGDARVAQLRAPTGELLFPFVTNAVALGVVLQVTAVWQIIVSLRSTRLFLARFLPLDPASAVHTLALVCAGWLMAVSFIQLTQSSVAEIVQAIGSTPSYKKVLENPDAISRTVLRQGLEAHTAYEIVSIDIAQVQVGQNIGARLQADAAEADTRVARAKAEQRRAEAIALEQEMKAKVAENRSRLVQAEAEVPQAMAEAFRKGNLNGASLAAR